MQPNNPRMIQVGRKVLSGAWLLSAHAKDFPFYVGRETVDPSAIPGSFPRRRTSECQSARSSAIEHKQVASRYDCTNKQLPVSPHVASLQSFTDQIARSQF